MRRRRFQKFGKSIWYNQINARDLFDHRYFEMPRPMRHMFKVRDERDAAREAGRMFIDLLHMILEDLITERSQFVFPLPGFGILRIFDITDWVNPDMYEFDPDTNGRVYQVVPILARETQKKVGVPYMVRLWSHVQQKLNHHVKKYGSGYPKPPQQEQQVRHGRYRRRYVVKKPQGTELREGRPD